MSVCENIGPCVKLGAVPAPVISFSLSCALALPDTIRKMKNDFRKMEDEMDRLATNMAVITDFSARISATLQDRHERITKLAGGPLPQSGCQRGAVLGTLGLAPPAFAPQGSTRCCGSCSSSSSCPHASPSAWSWAPTGRRCGTRAARGPCCSSISTCPPSVPSRTTARSSQRAWPSSYGSASGVTPWSSFPSRQASGPAQLFRPPPFPPQILSSCLSLPSSSW